MIFIYHSRSFTTHVFITNQLNDQLPVGLLAQLVEYCIGIAEVMGLTPVHTYFFFFFFGGFNFTTAKVVFITAKIILTFKINGGGRI